MDIILPTPDIILAAHTIVLDTSGGKKGVHDEKILDGAIARPLTYTQYVDRYDIDTICALLVDSLARNHGFNDGNKRTAMMTAIITYRMNKVIFQATGKLNKDFDDLVMWVVNEKPSIDTIQARLRIIRKQHEGESAYSEMINSFFIMLRKRK